VESAEDGKTALLCLEKFNPRPGNFDVNLPDVIAITFAKRCKTHQSLCSCQPADEADKIRAFPKVLMTIYQAI